MLGRLIDHLEVKYNVCHLKQNLTIRMCVETNGLQGEWEELTLKLLSQREAEVCAPL